jgi:hypothetical protein
MAKPPSEMAEEEAKAAKLEERRRERAAAALSERRGDAAAELQAMQDAVNLLLPLPKDSQKRALRWVADRLDNFPDPAHDYYSDEPPF